MNRLIIIMTIFSLFSCKVKYLADTKYYIQDIIELDPKKFEDARTKLKTYIEKEYNNNKSRPRVVSTSFYLMKNHPYSKYITKVVILTNFVNERSRKYEFDNLQLYGFIQKNISNMERNIGGGKEDFNNDNYELLFCDQYINYRIDQSWINEDPSKISLFHNDYNILEKISIKGFDKSGEPEIRLMIDGSLILAFNFMPPSNGKDPGGELGEFKDFDKYLTEKLGVEVTWADREIFYIKNPKKDTAKKLKEILENYWTNNN